MLLVLRLFWAVAALELLLWLLPSLSWRQKLAAFVMAVLAVVSVSIVIGHPGIATGVLLIMSLYRLCNLLRVVKVRMSEKYLHKSTVRTSLWIIGLQALVVLLWWLGNRFQLSTYQWWLILLYVDVAGGIVVLATTIRHLRTTRPPQLSDPKFDESSLPTLTVAIPARNETDDLEICLRSLVASDYPKLEVIVYDDCSQNRRTPEIIRSFAHDGVRFVQGEVPEENWLAKNQAYQQLFRESNGELLLFCGVDVRFEPQSLRWLVAAMLQKHKTMISLIPQNAVPARSSERGSSLLQPMRYTWELALPRKLFRRPPVLSTCWIVKRELVDNAGGFAAVSRSIVPESYFGRVSAVHDGYSFMQASGNIGISCDKTFAEQRATAIRTRYPQTHRRIEVVMLLTLAELATVILPYVLVVVGIFGGISLQLTLASLFAAACFTYVYIIMVALTYRRWLVRSIGLLPFATMLDIVLLNYSMLRYEFFSVIWKDRNICVPVMHVSAEAFKSSLSSTQPQPLMVNVLTGKWRH